jgi:hypothetical protein
VTSINNNLLSDLDAVKANNALLESKFKVMEYLERSNAVLQDNVVELEKVER